MRDEWFKILCAGRAREASEGRIVAEGGRRVPVGTMLCLWQLNYSVSISVMLCYVYIIFRGFINLFQRNYTHDNNLTWYTASRETVDVAPVCSLHHGLEDQVPAVCVCVNVSLE